MKDWGNVKLKDITLLITDGKHGDCQNENNSGYYFISAKDVHDWRISYENARQITEADFLDTHRRTKFEKDDVVIVSTGANIGDIAIARNNEKTQKTTFQKSVAIVKADKSKASPLYIAYFLNNSRIELHNVSSGSAQKNLLLKDLRDFKILLPPLPTQRRIASILSAYDDLIENNLKRIKLLEELAQRTYEEWFVNLRVNGEHLEMNSETGLPKEWKNIPIGTFIKFQKGKKVNSISAGYKESWEKLLLLDGIESGKYPYTDPNGQIIAERGDLIMLMDGARSSKVFFADKGVVGSTISKIVITNKKISSSLLKHFFESNFEWMQINNTGAAIPHANKNFIIKMPFKLPTNEFLDKWALTIEPIYTQIQNLKDQNLLLKESRDIILPRLMSGKIEVQGLREEELAIAAEPETIYKSR